jgi:serine/threonine-protein kinase/endoribonuclease IRE1
MIDSRILDNLGKYRKYDFSKISDLLRLIRNKSHHYRDLPEEVRLTVIGPPPSQFLCYFISKFPLLFIHVYIVIQKHCKDEHSFKHYFVNNNIK